MGLQLVESCIVRSAGCWYSLQLLAVGAQRDGRDGRPTWPNRPKQSTTTNFLLQIPKEEVNVAPAITSSLPQLPNPDDRYGMRVQKVKKRPLGLGAKQLPLMPVPPPLLRSCRSSAACPLRTAMRTSTKRGAVVRSLLTGSRGRWWWSVKSLVASPHILSFFLGVKNAWRVEEREGGGGA
jgi:hypothetical protein